MSAAVETQAGGYRPALALRHLWRGALAPGQATREALAAGIGEWARLALFALYVACLGLVDPETRTTAWAAVENVFDDSSRLVGIGLLLAGLLILVGALLLAYWAAAFVIAGLAGGGWTWARLRAARSALALSAWFALLPTILAKAVALAVLPPGMVTADPPSLFTAIEIAVGLPYLAVCLAVALGVGIRRAALTAILVNGGFYLLIVLLYLAVPSP